MIRNMFSRYAGLLVASLVIFCMQHSIYSSEPYGGVPLRVENGVFIRNGKEYSGIGVNYFDLFRRLIEKGVIREERIGPVIEKFSALKKYHVPFVRFAACGFYPVEVKLYQQSPDKYFALMDKIVKQAEIENIGLIPSLFWQYFAVPDLVGEHISKWGDSESQTRNFMREYTTRFVERYKHSPAIWGWEFGNEYVLEADHPQDIKPDQWVIPALGTALKRTNEDKLSSVALISMYEEFSRLVRGLDPHRPIFTGDAIARASSYNLSQKLGWKPDTTEEWSKFLESINPGNMNSLSVHVYYPKKKVPANSVYGIRLLSLDGQLGLLENISMQSKKPIWLGEFGCSTEEDSVEERYKNVDEFIKLIKKHKIGLAAYWVYDCDNPQLKAWNATENNENASILNLIKEANE